MRIQTFDKSPLTRSLTLATSPRRGEGGVYEMLSSPHGGDVDGQNARRVRGAKS